MFIVSRRFGQSVVIGEEVFCSIVGICGNQVRLGFEAPKDISIYRKEMVQHMLAEKQRLAAQTNVDEELITLLTQQFRNNTKAA